jgi:hypothetical protein
MIGSLRAPGSPMSPASFLGHSTHTSRVVKEPPNSGQSTETKHKNPQTGIAPQRGRLGRERLFENAFDELAAVAGADHQLLGALPQDPTVGPQLWPALVLLGVDDEHPEARTTEWSMFAGSPDASVVQHPDRGVGEGIEATSQAFLAAGADRLRLGALGVVGQLEHQPPSRGLFLGYADTALTRGLCVTVRLLALRQDRRGDRLRNGAGRRRPHRGEVTRL